MLKRSLFFIVVVCLTFTVWLGSSSKPGMALQGTQQATIDPTSQTVKNNVNVAGSDALIPLPAPADMRSQLDTILKLLSATVQPSNQVFALNDAIYAFSAFDFTDKGKAKPSEVKSVVVPLLHSGDTRLGPPDPKDPDLKTSYATTPDDKQPANIVGGIYLSTLGPNEVVILVCVNCTDGKDEKNIQSRDLRFYDQNGKQVIVGTGFVSRRFAGQQFVAEPYDGDEGALISAAQTCFNVGLDQLCYKLNLSDDIAAGLIKAAMNQFDAVTQEIYKVKAATAFDETQALGDLLGDAQRTVCADALVKKEKEFKLGDPTPADCRPTTVFAPPKQELTRPYNGKTLRLVALLLVLDSKGIEINKKHNPDGEIHDPTKGRGARKEKLDIKDVGYVMADPDPNSKPGDNLVLYLLDPNLNESYMPGWRIEGFGIQSPGDTTPVLTAYIKDQCGDSACWP